MLEFTGNLFADRANPKAAFCIPTNGNINKNNKAVMGAGIAKLVRDAFAGSDAALGALLKANGHIVQQFHSEPILISFPTKVNWQDDSKIEMIQESTEQLLEWSKNNLHVKRIYIPKVGAGLGKLDYESQVRPILLSVLTSDKFIAIIKD